MRPHAWLSSCLLLQSCLAAFHVQSHDDSTVQHRSPNLTRANAVRDAFQFAWDGYYKYAFPNDELAPVSNTFLNPRNGWGATPVDALSTAIVMDLQDVVTVILDFIPTIDFSTSYQDEVVSVFETTIRYVAGMLSGYDFLSGPKAHLSKGKAAEVSALLAQAERLANLLSVAFDTPTGIPSNNVFFNNGSLDEQTTNGLATIGSLVLEWTHLADLTGNQTYARLAQTAESYLLDPKPRSDEPWPGLLGTNVAIANGSFLDADGGWQGGDDSFYEYLLKMYVYDWERFGHYKDRWILAADSSIAHLASHPSSRPDLTFLAEFSGRTTINESQHLACFDGGNFILGGTTLNKPKYTRFGLKLVAACHETYTSTATGIGPELFSWNVTTLPADQEDFYDEHGFWIPDADYVLRPEVLESYYYAYQATGDSKYQDWSWDAFVAINASTRTDTGFSDITNVTIPGGGDKTDVQESFLFAEVMKYAYLIHAPERAWDVQPHGNNRWVFNTEGHPLRAFCVAPT